MNTSPPARFDDPVIAHARKDLPLLRADMNIQEALEAIRREGIGERIIYFYAVDADGPVGRSPSDPAVVDRFSSNQA